MSTNMNMPTNTNMPTNMKRRKIAVLGSRSVGKSSLVKQFIDSNFSDSYYPTIESTFTKSIVYNGVEYNCEIIDTAGQDQYTILNTNYAIGIHGYILVYSIAAKKSFEMIQIIHDKIADFSGVSKLPCVIVGSKSDLSTKRVVDSKDGEQLAKDLGGAWIETSAKDNTNVDKVFELCLQEIQKTIAPTQPEPGLTCTMQ